MKSLKRCICCLFATVFALFGGMSVYADSSKSFESYRYDYWDTPLSMPSGYEASEAVIDTHMEIGAGDEKVSSKLKDPEDLFYSEDGFFYVVDTGNNRIIKLDKNIKCVEIFDEFTDKDGTVLKLNAPTGIFVEKNGDMYIADGGNQRVIIASKDTKVKGMLTKPDADIYPQNIDFQVSNILRDKNNKTYVIVKSLYYGALVFDQNDNFSGFYGTNRVQLTASQMVQVIWRKILPRSMQSSQSRYVPIEFDNMDIDSDGFIYTCSQTAGKSEKIKKLNAMGLNILQQQEFGDKGVTGSTGNGAETQFVDLDIDENGFINALDYRRGRVFQYNNDGDLIFVFGGIGSQLGLFSKPAAIESVDGKVYVLDSAKCSITVFTPNTLAKNTHRAVRLYEQGLYDDAIEPWQDVLRIDTGNTFAYTSLGKAYYSSGKYEAAMENFKLGQDREGYSKAFREYRSKQIKKNIVPIVAAVLGVIVICAVIAKRRKYAHIFAKVGIHISAVKQEKKMKGARYIGLIVRHPIEGFNELKYRKNGSISVAWIIVLLWFVLSVVDYGMTGFIFNTNKIEQINIGILFLSTVCVFLFWVISNWCFCTLLNGEGKIKEIFIYSAYALVPYLCSILTCVILSNVLTADEGVFITWIKILGILWTAFLLFCGMMTLHNYSGSRTVFSVIITLLGMIIIVFLIVLAFSLVQQVIAFVMTVVRELQFRQY